MTTIILIWIVVGVIAGFLARLVVRGEGPGGIIGDLVLGILGAIVGGWLSGLVGLHQSVSGINLASILVAFIGAVVILGVMRMLDRGR